MKPRKDLRETLFWLFCSRETGLSSESGISLFGDRWGNGVSRETNGRRERRRNGRDVHLCTLAGRKNRTSSTGGWSSWSSQRRRIKEAATPLFGVDEQRDGMGDGAWSRLAGKSLDFAWTTRENSKQGQRTAGRLSCVGWLPGLLFFFFFVVAAAAALQVQSLRSKRGQRECRRGIRMKQTPQKVGSGDRCVSGRKANGSRQLGLGKTIQR